MSTILIVHVSKLDKSSPNKTISDQLA